MRYPLPRHFSPDHPEVTAQPKRKASGHTMPIRPSIDLSGPGRMRVAHLLWYLSISHSTFYKRLKAGQLPPPDGRDGKLPYWNTATVRVILRC